MSSGYRRDYSAKGKEMATMDQLSAHLGDDGSLLESSPPASSPPRVSGGPSEKGNALPGGAAPPTIYTPREKQVYRPL